MPIRIVVADQSEARFYDLEHFDAPLRLVGKLTDPKAHLHDRDLKSDRPGRVFDRAAAEGQRRGAVAHHGTGGERSPRKHEAQLFAKRIAEELKVSAGSGQFDQLVVMAGPAFLGLLRSAMPSGLQSSVVAEVPKDLIHEAEGAIRSHLPREILRGGSHKPP